MHSTKTFRLVTIHKSDLWKKKRKNRASKRRIEAMYDVGKCMYNNERNFGPSFQLQIFVLSNIYVNVHQYWFRSLFCIAKVNFHFVMLSNPERISNVGSQLSFFRIKKKTHQNQLISFHFQYSIIFCFVLWMNPFQRQFFFYLK